MRFPLMIRLLSTSSWATIKSVHAAREFLRALANDVSMATLSKGTSS